jgi:hypothetical protein
MARSGFLDSTREGLLDLNLWQLGDAVWLLEWSKQVGVEGDSSHQ